MIKPPDLLNKKFGKLTVIAYHGVVNRRSHWVCICDCNPDIKIIKKGYDLQCGDTKSCGCLIPPPTRDRTGDKVGKLSILEKVYVGKALFYRCLCDCGKTITVKAGPLNKKNPQKSCGCIRKELRKPHKNFFINRDTVEIAITSKDIDKIATVDLEDWDKVKSYSWYMGEGYVVTVVNKRSIPIHYFLLPKKKGFITDHIDRNTLNNKKSNLRYATAQQNNWNRSKSKSNTTGFIGLIYLKKRGIYVARLQNKDVGSSKDKIEAAKIRDRAALNLYKDFAVLNFPELKDLYLKEIEIIN